MVIALAVFTGSVTAAEAGTAARSAGPGGGRAAVADGRPFWAAASADRGPADPGTRLAARVYLAGRDARGLAAFDAAVSDPHSPSYQRYLTPAQYQARFGPTQAQIGSVTSWLKSAGLTVTGMNQHYVSVHGSVAQAEKAFGTAIDYYTDHSAGNAVHYAPAGRITVPGALSASVLGVTGLDNGSHLAHPASMGAATGPLRGVSARHAGSPAQPDDTLPGPAPVILRAAPCSAYYGQNPATGEPATYGHTGVWTNCGYTPQQMRSAYGVSSGPAGAGQTVAIVDAYASPTIASDVQTFASHHGIAGFRPGQFTQNLPSGWNSVSACGGSAWYYEESLDVTAVHDIAPDANVVYAAAASCQDTDLSDALNRIVDGRLATIVSNSWNDDLESHTSEAVRSVYDQVFLQGAAEGIGFYFSSGDCGEDDPHTGCPVYADGPGTEWPPSDPHVTAVGGTTLEVGANGSQVWQTGWGDVASALTPDGTGWTPAPGTGYPATFEAGAGGGTSALYGQPSYQAGVVPASLSETLPDGSTTTTPMRVVPDVAADADNNTGILVGQTQTYLDGSTRYHETRWGGTSLACPVFAALQALAQQTLGRPLGFANPALYARYGTYALQDVTDSPLGPGTLLGVVRNDYTNVSDPTSPVTTRVITFGDDGLLHATTGYDDVTGVGAPSTDYVDSYDAAGKGIRSKQPNAIASR
ncbi:MAG: S8/S53 family peptidase [Streptosporangiaceae bacterium]|nr:S8/S53 family peptidase [Streptosporangiaceae bacterium]MBV9855138.1 S8/S53 family peptidase [Streptosporangiaceae bacterium]